MKLKLSGTAVIVLLLTIVSFLTIPNQYALYFVGIIYSITTIGYFVILYFVKQTSSGKNITENIQLQDHVHNEFSKVPKGPGAAQGVKPIDLSGNVFEHNIETINEDLKNIGINVKDQDNTDKEE